MGVVGVNGAGKSTLLKALAGELKPVHGEVSLGLYVEVAYFAQHVAEKLDPDQTVLQAMGAHAHPDTKRQDILDLAGSLLFGGDDTAKKIRVLSGGEKSRVALGQILLRRASCLLLDEPTNHLDFHTVEALTQALSTYEGSVVIVSHDRGFVQRTASKILEIRDGRAEFYPGTYDEYVWSVANGALKYAREREAASGGGRIAVAEVLDAAPARVNTKELRKSLEREIRALEKEMAAIEVDGEKSRAQILVLTEELVKASSDGTAPPK